ncbi:MAG: hypothetical protein ACYDGN_16535 [Acidimicrobiales bacterium]
MRFECLDWTLIAGHRRLEQVLDDHVCYYNGHRPHGASALPSQVIPRVSRPVTPLATSSATT